MADLASTIRAVQRTRSLTDSEIDGLRARGNRGDLNEILLGDLFRPEGLAAIHGTTFVGPNLLLGPAGIEVENATLRASILGPAEVRSSEVSQSVVGGHVHIRHHSVIESSVLLPFNQRVEGASLLFQLTINASQVRDSILLGGSDIGPFAHVRSHSVVGPFAHVGTGSEVKASCLLGATPRNRIEVPHRSYLGNAAAKALRLEADFGTDEYDRELEQKLPALLFGELEASIADEDVPGAVQPLERLRLRWRGEVVVVEVEGVNFGALTTTSNFDPRNGGFKMPSNIEAGVRFGILSLIQAPAHVAPGVLVASGAKVTGASVPPASLVLGGTERAGVLPGYLQQNRARLGDGTSENVALVRSYLRQLRSLQRAFHESAGSAEGLERVAVHRIHLALGYQMAELASWLHRYLDLVRISAERIAQGLPYEGNIERHKRLSARLSDQRKIAEVAPAQIADLERMREEARKESEALFALAAPERLADEHRHRWTTRALRQPEVLRLLPPATVSDEVEARAAVQASREHHEIGRLFGTSGIRGVFQRGSALSPISAFEREGVITPALGYLLGRALGRLLQRPGHPRAAGIALDGRVSGPRIAAPLRDGLCDEGIDVLDEGVCTTPAAASLPDRLSLIVTASHSPPTHNGVKVYLDGVPLSRDHENEVEEEMRVLETLVLRGRALAPMRAARERGQVRDATQDAADHHRTRLRAELEHLGLAGKLRGRRLPIDLARGAAAAKPGGEEIVPSPAMAMYLEEGVVLVAYGGERDGERINDRLGAAYPYGEVRYLAEGSERDVHPAAGELLALARGAYGYGAGRTADGHAAGLPASRTIYWPASLELPTTLRRFARPVAGGHLAFLDVDSPGSEAMRSGLEAVLAKMPLLTAISVDGDADRVLLTDPEAARRDIPFLTGDALLMVFAAYDPDNVRRVVFTVESDLTLEKFLTAREIPFDVVTVGDRAVAECILARARTSGVDGAFLLGGEPSGHLIFTVPDGDDLRLIEDPFAVHLRALALVERQGRSLGEMLFGLSEQVVEAPAARKPDAWAPDPATGGGGLTLAEKAQLTLRGRGQSALSDYASRFVPECLRIFGNGYARAFHGERAEAEPLLSEAFDNLCAGRGEAAAGKREVRIGEIAVSVGGAVEERITAALQITAIPYFGPDDVVLRFYAPDADGLPCKIGEIVARNSGTAAKNAAYVKLWPVHPGSGRRLDPDGLREVVDEMARQRAAFTDRYVLDYLRRR